MHFVVIFLFPKSLFKHFADTTGRWHKLTLVNSAMNIRKTMVLTFESIKTIIKSKEDKNTEHLNTIIKMYKKKKKF